MGPPLPLPPLSCPRPLTVTTLPTAACLARRNGSGCNGENKTCPLTVAVPLG
jgi:hypothetical protein